MSSSSHGYPEEYVDGLLLKFRSTLHRAKVDDSRLTALGTVDRSVYFVSSVQVGIILSLSIQSDTVCRMMFLSESSATRYCFDLQLFVTTYLNLYITWIIIVLGLLGFSSGDLYVYKYMI